MRNEGMQKEGKVTLKTLAEKLGVSITTVSRALDDGYKTSPELIERVRSLADQLGYVRNLDGVKLRTGKTLVMMALLGFTRDEEVGDSASVGLLTGIHQRFSETAYSVRTAPLTREDNGLHKVRELTRGRNADGLILDHTESEDARVDYLLKQQFPFITFGRGNRSEEHPHVDIDNEFAAWQGTHALLEAGYRRVALIDADPIYEFVRQRKQGYVRALQEAGMPVDESLICHISPMADQARQAACSLMPRGADAFVCVNENVFLGARAGVRMAGADTLESTGFSVRTGTNIAEYIGTPVFASHYSRESAGWQLADNLLDWIGGADVQSCQTVVRTKLRVYPGFS